MKAPYPAALEDWMLARVAEEEGGIPEGYPDRKVLHGKLLGRVVERVDRLSQGFTTERGPGFDDYSRDRKMLAAYGLFFFPQTFVRTRAVWDELTGRAGWTPPSPLRVLDLGCGLGAAGLSVAHAAAERGIPVRLDAVDASLNSLRWLQRLAKDQGGLFGDLRLHTLSRQVGPDLDFRTLAGHRWDLIVASFALNEIFEGRPQEEFDAFFFRAAASLSERGVLLVMEPALRASAERLERLRDAVAGARLEILAPCLHRHACPLLAEGKFWCHEVRRWEAPEALSLLNRNLRRSAEDTLKFSFLAVAPRGAAAAVAGGAESFRLVSPVARRKGVRFMTGCNAVGEKAEYELQNRDAVGAEEWLDSLERGDVVNLPAVEALGGPRRYRIPPRG